MELLDPRIQAYSEKHTTPESDVLRKINRETHTEVLRPRMLSGHLQGRLLSMISHMIRPKFVLDIGTYTGYSALCFAEGVLPGGKVITIDTNDELESRVRAYFKESGFSDRIDYRIGKAANIIPELHTVFDLVFIDADKENYCRYYDLVFDNVRPGGFIVADNVLWSGKVLDVSPDKDTQAILDFNAKVQSDQRVHNVLLPIRDGITVIQKIG